MIYWLSKEDFLRPPKRVCADIRDAFSHIRPMSYESLFYSRAVPAGHYIFTDFDRLSVYELESLIALVRTIRKVSPDSIILNHPGRVLERVPLLAKLYELKLNDFSVTRVDAGEKPSDYPVFLRAEDGCILPYTQLIHSGEEFEQALAGLRERGLSVKRKIAVRFCSQPDEEGWYRKYGAFIINGTIIPGHIQRNRDWIVKSNGADYDERFSSEELDWVMSNPHEKELSHIFKVANIDFGRIDYTLVDGKIQTFEINTNPTYPRLRGIRDRRRDGRQTRRAIIRTRVVEALGKIEAVNVPNKTIRFDLPQPILHKPTMPRKSIAGRVFYSLYWACSRLVSTTSLRG